MIKNDYFENWIDSCRESEPKFDTAYFRGWNDCKAAILEILKQNWTDCDLSINNCDQYYIDKIEKEI